MIGMGRGMTNSSNPAVVMPTAASKGWDLPAWLAWLLLVAICFAFFGQPTPDVNESHYLTKAKQFWDPNWCPGDLFLESADAHWLFFGSTGWLTRFCSLELYAWIGRIASWALFGFAWLQLSQCIHAKRWFSLVSLALFLLLNLRFHLAGEWVVGGFEGKSLAYGFGIWAVATWLRGQWPPTVLLLGAAIGFHALAGLWLALAIFLVTCSLGLPAVSRAVRECTEQRTCSGWLQLGGGIALAFSGILPGLLSQTGVSGELLQEAAWIQVTQRLSHHLWFTAFPTSRVAMFALLTLLSLLLSRCVLWPREPALLFRLAQVGILINLAGLCLSAAVAEQGRGAEVACSLLRFYWFRFADCAVPLAVGQGVSWLLAAWLRPGNPARMIWCTRITGLALLAACVLQAVGNWEPQGAAGDAAALERFPGEPEKERKLATNWRQVCQWIAANTPTDATFITPARQQTFKWHAGRAEVVCWKDMPQDPAAIVEWSQRIAEVYRPQIDYELGLLAFDDEQLRELGRTYGASYLLLRQADYDRVRERCQLQRVYPEEVSARVSFVVLKL